jgi:aspartyl-tRNA(Asn)/glutamyl-tRNA(Gln) amidotransferase subunit B
MSGYVTSVGMEVHAELLTRSKMFCRCPVAFGGEPNTRVCPVCLGLPGALPVPNRAAIEMVLRTALALNCKVAYDSVFHRKNYFYPDLPKGFQVSQYGETNPIGYHGWLDVPRPEGGTKRVRIRRVHLEEDTGKLVHLGADGSGVDYNRAGVPLMEIVTDFPPDIESADLAREYLVQLRAILVWLGVCDGKMEEGSLRCEPNVSIRPVGSDEYGTKTEIKNLNSFRSVQLGVEFESARQAALLDSGGTVVQETRGWNEATQTSYVMRAKESEQDYRYFTDPDLAPMRFEPDQVEATMAALPELPLAKAARFQADFGLSEEDAGRLVQDRAWAEWFEECVRLGGPPKAVCNWMNAEFAKLLNETGQSVSVAPLTRVTPEMLVGLVRLVEEGMVSGKTAKELFRTMFETGESADSQVAASGLTQISDAGLIAEAVRAVLDANPEQLSDLRGGKTAVLGYLIGQVMKATQGRANAPMVQAEVRRQAGLE